MRVLRTGNGNQKIGSSRNRPGENSVINGTDETLRNVLSIALPVNVCGINTCIVTVTSNCPSTIINVVSIIDYNCSIIVKEVLRMSQLLREKRIVRKYTIESILELNVNVNRQFESLS